MTPHVRIAWVIAGGAAALAWRRRRRRGPDFPAYLGDVYAQRVLDGYAARSTAWRDYVEGGS